MRAIIFAIASPLLLATASCTLPPPQPSTLRLGNSSIDRAEVQTVATTNPDCNRFGPGVVVSNFILPLKGTRIVTAPPGDDICWRYASLPPQEAAPPAAPLQWTDWSRAYLATAPRGVLDSGL